MNLPRKSLILPAVLVGVLILVVLVKTRQQPNRTGEVERSRVVRVIPAPSVAMAPRAVGHGFVVPVKSWDAVAQVPGEVVEVNADLDPGAILKGGVVLMRIDPGDYRLALDRALSQVADTRAQLDELERRENDISASLDTERRSLAISKKELDRRLELAGDGTISRSEADVEEQRWLAQQAKVLNLETEFNSVPSRRKALEARLASNLSGVKDARRDLARTVIRTPFDCRLTQVSVEKGQYAKAGQVVAVADGLDAAEISAQVPVEDLAALLNGAAPSDSGGDAGTSAPASAPVSAPVSLDMAAVRKAVSMRAVVRLSLPGGTVEWPAEFSRFSETMDPATRTVGVYVRLDAGGPLGRGGRPPLVRNLYCEVELTGAAGPEVVVVPRSAVRNGEAYLAGADDRLVIRPITRGLAVGGVVAITSGISAGERVIVSDVAPAVEGMLLEPMEDGELLARLKAEALGVAGAAAVREGAGQ